MSNGREWIPSKPLIVIETDEWIYWEYEEA